MADQLDIPQKFRDKLVVLPGVPGELESINPYVNFILGKNKTVQSLYYMGMRGLVVWKRVDWPSNESTSDAEESDKPSHGCLFIPAPNFDRVVIVKNISDLSRDEAITQFLNSVTDQLQCLQKIVSNLTVSSEMSQKKLKMHIYFCLFSNIKKSTKFEDLRNSLASLVDNYIFFDLTTSVINDKMLQKQLSISLQKNSECNPVVIPRLIAFFESQFSQKLFYHLQSQATDLSKTSVTESDHVNKIIQRFETFFPNRQEKLLTIPHINQLEDNMLYAYTDQGELGEFCSYASYLGEVRLFSEKILAPLKNPSGILIKSFSNKHLETILNVNFLFPQQFEFDWLYLGADKVVVFEVGMCENAAQPKPAIRNKIKQVITQIIPQMQLILYSLLKSDQLLSSAYSENNYASIFEELLKVVIFIPGMTFDTFNSAISDILKKAQKTLPNECLQCEEMSLLELIALENRHYLSSHISFLLESTGTTRNLKLVKINENFEVVDGEQTVDDIFKSHKSEEIFFKYFSSLITAASLNLIVNHKEKHKQSSALDLDKRYHSSFKKWLKCFRSRAEQPSSIDRSETEHNLMLSPQQHRILTELRSHLMITGMPGSGKTILLLAMCEIIALDENVEQIVFLYHKGKTVFQKFFTKIWEKYCSEIMKSKASQFGMYGYELKDFLNQNQNVENLHKKSKMVIYSVN